MTLVEVMVGGILTVLALGAILTFVESSFTHTRAVGDRVSALDDTTRAFERMIREIRTAAVVTPVDSGMLRLRRWVGGDDTQMHVIQYACGRPDGAEGAGRCTRQDITAGGPPAEFVTGVLNEDVFTTQAAIPPALNPSVGLRLEMQVPDRDTPIVLDGHATSRNCSFTDGSLGACET